MRRSFAILLAACLAAAAPAGAQGLFGQKTDYAEVMLHTGRSADDGVRIAALRMEMKPGWKTYWRNPGDAGIPPRFDWTGSENLKSVDIAWPTPVVFNTYGSRTIGYEERMVLPLTLTPERRGEPITVNLNFSYGLCSDICIPAHEEVSVTIAPDAPEDGGYFIDRAFDQTPVSAAEGGLSARDCRVVGAGQTRTFSAALRLSAPLFDDPIIVAEGPSGVWFGPVSTRIEDDLLIGEGLVRTEEGRWIDRSAMQVTVLGASRAIQMDGCLPTG